MKDYIANLKQKPEHVRKRIALGASAGFTGLIAVAWLGTMAATGSFALVPVGNGAEPAPVALTSTNVKSNFSQLMGAVGAVTSGSSTKPALTIVDGEEASTFDTKETSANNTSATVLSF